MKLAKSQVSTIRLNYDLNHRTNALKEAMVMLNLWWKPIQDQKVIETRRDVSDIWTL